MHLEADEIGELAAIVCETAGCEPVEGRIALAWLAHNMVSEAGLSVRESCRRIARLAMPTSSLSAIAKCQDACAFGVLLCQVCFGELADPTHGATAAHRHTEQPDWANHRIPTALIGPWFFYRARGRAKFSTAAALVSF